MSNAEYERLRREVNAPMAKESDEYVVISQEAVVKLSRELNRIGENLTTVGRQLCKELESITQELHRINKARK